MKEKTDYRDFIQFNKKIKKIKFVKRALSDIINNFLIEKYLVSSIPLIFQTENQFLLLYFLLLFSG